MDDTGGDVTLQFGETLGEQIFWDSVNSQFVFTDDVNIQGNIDVDGILTAGTGDVALTNAAGNIDGEVIQDDTIDEDSIDFGTGAGQVGGTDIVVTDTFDNSNATEVQTALDDIDAAIGDKLYTNDHIVTDAETTTASLDAIDTALGDRTYTDDNYVTDGETITASIDALDQAINGAATVHITMNDLTVQEDGTSNLVDVYNDSETGANPHQYYLLKTQQTSLQDIDLKFKVRLPENFTDFSGTGDLSFFYKNTGVDNTDSKIDILVEDKEGDDAFTAADGQNLFNTAWTEYTDEFDGGTFDPVAGDYIYVTVKGYTSRSGATQQNPYIGEIVLKF